MRRLLILVMVLVVSGFSYIASAATQSQAAVRKPAASAKSAIDDVIELVKEGTSETMIISILQRQGKAYSISTSDLVKLQKAGVSENIINVMMDPRAVVKTAVGPPPSTIAPSPTNAPATTNPALSAASVPSTSAVPVGEETPPPPDLIGIETASSKPRLIVDSFSYRDSQEFAQYWFNNNSVDIGAGVSDMLSSRLNNTSGLTLLERSKLKQLENEQDRTLGTQFDQGNRTQIGRLLGANYLLVGDIFQFGWDNKTKKLPLPSLVIPKILPLGNFDLSHTDYKAKVRIVFRVVDAETGEQVPGLSGEAIGESSRSANKYQGTFVIRGAGWINGGGDISSTAFCKTIIGEATSSAVDKIVSQLAPQIAQLPPKPRHIDGKVAKVEGSRVYLVMGSDEGVLKGDRFAVFQITDEIFDPDTKERLDFQTVKVGELVVDDVRPKIASGNYGGKPLPTECCNGKGYLARLMSK